MAGQNRRRTPKAVHAWMAVGSRHPRLCANFPLIKFPHAPCIEEIPSTFLRLIVRFGWIVLFKPCPPSAELSILAAASWWILRKLGRKTGKSDPESEPSVFVMTG
jgi:hypothetical protein